MSDSINVEKYKGAILYFVENCNNRFLGYKKLNKLLYYLDFLNYRDRGESVTGDVYYNQEYGPVPSASINFVNMLVKENLLKINGDPYIEESKNKYKIYENIGKPDNSVFSKEEVDLLSNICREFKNYDTKKIVAQTHLEAPWFYAEPQQEIDYEYSSSIEVLDEDNED